MLLLSVDLVLKVFMTPRPESLQANFRWKSKINRLFSKHFLVYYLFYDLYVVDLIIFILYVSSFIVPYEVAKYTRMAVAFKLIAVVKFN